MAVQRVATHSEAYQMCGMDKEENAWKSRYCAWGGVNYTLLGTGAEATMFVYDQKNHYDDNFKLVSMTGLFQDEVSFLVLSIGEDDEILTEEATVISHLGIALFHDEQGNLKQIQRYEWKWNIYENLDKPHAVIKPGCDGWDVFLLMWVGDVAFQSNLKKSFDKPVEKVRVSSWGW